MGLGGAAKLAGITGALLGKAGGAVAKGIGGLLPDAVSETVGQAASSVGDFLNAPKELIGEGTKGLLEASDLSEAAKGFVDPTTNPIEAFQGLVDSPSPTAAPNLLGENPLPGAGRDGGFPAPGGPDAPGGNTFTSPQQIQDARIQNAQELSRINAGLSEMSPDVSNQLQSGIEERGIQRYGPVLERNPGFQETLSNIEADMDMNILTGQGNEIFSEKFPSPVPPENVTGEMSQGIIDAEIGPLDDIYNPTLNPENSNLYRQFMDMPLKQKLMLGAGLGYGTDYIMQLAEVGPYEEEKEWWEDYQGGSSQNPSWRGRGSPSFSSVYPSTREINYYR